MDDIAVQLGKAADQDLAIDQDLFKIFEDSYRAFDGQVDEAFEGISSAMDDTIGNAGLFNTKGMVDDAKLEIEKYVAAQPGTNSAAARDALQKLLTLVILHHSHSYT